MTFQILSLSGGGYLGLYTISVIEKIEQTSNCPIAKSFDLLAGTSIGGILALALALEIPASNVRDAFEKDGQAIFSPRPKPKGFFASGSDFMRSLKAPKYASQNLRETITRLVGKETLIGDLLHPTIVPAVNLTKGQPQIFKTPHHKNFTRDLRLKVVDVAMATSAAPTFFSLANIPQEGLFADGGLYANSPDLIALHEAEHFLCQQVNNIHMLSIGTTTSKFSFSHEGGREFGIWHWAKNQRLLRASLSSQQQLVDFMLQHKLGNQYLRIDELQSAEQEQDLALDVATQQAKDTIAAIAEGSYRRFSPDNRLAQLIANTAPQPIFHQHPSDEKGK